MNNTSVNFLGKEIFRIRDKARYDACARRLAAYRPILARIPKYCCDEFKELAETEIMKRITGIQIAGSQDEKGRIFSLYNETELPEEGKAVFDVHFLALAPETNERHDNWIEVNLELNNGIPEGYRIVNRTMFNDARMISEQGGTLIHHMKYDNMPAVYSIFVVFGAPRKYGNLVCSTRMQFQKHYDAGVEKEDYENQKAIIRETMLAGSLRVLFSEKIKLKYKVQLLEKKYGIRTTRKMEREMNIMCSLNDGIEEKESARALQEED